jgi:hypothetical protein
MGIMDPSKLQEVVKLLSRRSSPRSCNVSFKGNPINATVNFIYPESVIVKPLIS